MVQCLDSTFQTEGDQDTDNRLLLADSKTEAELGIYLHPGVSINNITYKGYLEGEDIHNAICASLSPKPPNCRNPFEEMVDLSGEFESAIKFAEDDDKERL